MNEKPQARALASAKRATIRDVAAKAHVSIKTVSRVFNKEPAVRASTRDRVLEAAEVLNFEPHPMARALAARRTNSMGLIYENPAEFSYVQKAFNGILDACLSRGLSLLMHPCPEEVPIDDVRRFVRQTRVDSVVLLAPLGDRPDIIEMLKEFDIPMARVSPGTEVSEAISVNPKDMEACALLTEHVLSYGHRRIGFIKGDPRHGSSHKRLHGFLATLRRHGRLPDECMAAPGCFTFDSGKQAAHELFRKRPKPTAIIASNDDMAAGAIVAARELGMDVPRDVSVVGFDDSPIASHTWPPLTTMRQPISQMASAAANQLIEQAVGENGELSRQEFDCELVVRASLAECPPDLPATPRPRATQPALKATRT